MEKFGEGCQQDRFLGIRSVVCVSLVQDETRKLDDKIDGRRTEHNPLTSPRSFRVLPYYLVRTGKYLYLGILREVGSRWFLI